MSIATILSPSADISESLVFSLISGDMEWVNELIQKQLDSDISLIQEVLGYIVHAGGKRIRPALVLLIAGALGDESRSGHTHKHTLKHQLAAVIEIIHTATLLHDDVIDESMLRRGIPSANARFGNAASVLIGDFLYTRAFQMMVDAGDMHVMHRLSDTTNIIASGEVMQLANKRNTAMDESLYLKIIDAKTAKLFEASAIMGALAAKAPDKLIVLCAQIGHLMGMAFQLIDDMLDYSEKSKELGKNTGDDLREGKMTLPLIYVMEHGTQKQREMICDYVEKHITKTHEMIMAAVAKSDALAYTYNKARLMTDKATEKINQLPDGSHGSLYKEALLALCALALNRKS